MRNRLIKGVPSSAEGCGQQGRKQARHRLNFFFQAFWVAAGVCILAVALQSVQQLSSRFKWNSASLGLVLNHPLGFCSKVGFLNLILSGLPIRPVNQALLHKQDQSSNS